MDRIEPLFAAETAPRDTQKGPPLEALADSRCMRLPTNPKQTPVT